MSKTPRSSPSTGRLLIYLITSWPLCGHSWGYMRCCCGIPLFLQSVISPVLLHLLNEASHLVERHGLSMLVWCYLWALVFRRAFCFVLNPLMFTWGYRTLCSTCPYITPTTTGFQYGEASSVKASPSAFQLMLCSAKCWGNTACCMSVGETAAG